MIIKLAIKVRVQQFEGGRRINFGFSFKLHSTASAGGRIEAAALMLSQYTYSALAQRGFLAIYESKTTVDPCGHPKLLLDSSLHSAVCSSEPSPSL